MACFLENFGLGFMEDDKKALGGLIGQVIREGRQLKTRSLPYINCDFGNLQFVVRLKKSNSEAGAEEFAGFDTHVPGECVWTVRICEPKLEEEPDGAMSRIVPVQTEDGNGFVIVNVVNSEVLPSYVPGTVVKMQVCAFPSIVHLFENEEAYENAQKTSEDGKKWLMSDGVILPTGLLKNRNPNNEEFGENNWMDTLHAFKCTIKDRPWYGRIEFSEDIINEQAFILCKAETKFGEIEFAFSEDQITDEEFRCLKPGCIITGVCELSGDVAIYEYENGMIG